MKKPEKHLAHKAGLALVLVDRSRNAQNRTLVYRLRRAGAKGGLVELDVHGNALALGFRFSGGAFARQARACVLACTRGMFCACVAKKTKKTMCVHILKMCRDVSEGAVCYLSTAHQGAILQWKQLATGKANKPFVTSRLCC